MNAMTDVKSAAEALWFGNTRIAVRLASDAGNDGICVIEHQAPHGDSPPLHVHRNEDEVFHVLEGSLRFRVDGRDRTAGVGMVLVAPKGVPHTYRVESAEGARFLTITRGSDLENMLRAASRPALHPGLPAAATPTPEMIEALVGLAAANGIDIVGAPLA
jgi:quercetin dioxygenase-like cupin family protein